MLLSPSILHRVMSLFGCETRISNVQQLSRASGLSVETIKLAIAYRRGDTDDDCHNRVFAIVMADSGLACRMSTSLLNQFAVTR